MAASIPGSLWARPTARPGYQDPFAMVGASWVKIYKIKKAKLAWQWESFACSVSASELKLSQMNIGRPLTNCHSTAPTGQNCVTPGPRKRLLNRPEAHRGDCCRSPVWAREVGRNYVKSSVQFHI